jgi:hypothetical protein
MSKELRALVKRLRPDLRVTRGSKHYLILNVAGKRVGTLPCTASDWRALRNKERELARRGLLAHKG